VETAGTAPVKSTDLEKTVEAGDGLDCYLRLHRGHRSRGWLSTMLSSLARARARVSGNFRNYPNIFSLDDTTSKVVEVERTDDDRTP
jgi:hypothetical protein